MNKKDLAKRKDNIVEAKLTGVKHSPYKMRVVANRAKRMTLVNAQEMLNLSTKKASGFIAKVLDSAVANAENNNNWKKQDLRIREIQIGGGRIIKKPKYRARGRMNVRRSELSNVWVVLEINEDLVKAESPKKIAPKEATPKAKPAAPKKKTK